MGSPAVETCKRYILTFAKSTVRVQKTPSSYVLKHRVERWVASLGEKQYIRNSDFIEAARELGYKTEMRGQNAMFNISWRESP